MRQVKDVTTGEVKLLPDLVLTPEEIAAALEAERAQAEASRQAAYVREADPLFFKWQAGEGTEQEWLAKREEIRSRYPYPQE